MSTTTSDIKGWLETGKEKGASHVIVATDWFDYEDYPIFVKQGDNPKEHIPKDDRVMECYKLDIDWGKQLSEFRASHWDWEPTP